MAPRGPSLPRLRGAPRRCRRLLAFRRYGRNLPRFQIAPRQVAKCLMEPTIDQRVILAERVDLLPARQVEHRQQRDLVAPGRAALRSHPTAPRRGRPHHQCLVQQREACCQSCRQERPHAWRLPAWPRGVSPSSGHVERGERPAACPPGRQGPRRELERVRPAHRRAPRNAVEARPPPSAGRARP